MPDLDSLFVPVLSNHLLNVVLRKAGPNDAKAQQYLISFIRITDKALMEYKAARISLYEFVNSKEIHLSLIFQCVSHLETCLNSVRRALRFFDQMKRHQSGPFFQRQDSKLIDRYDKSITDIRHAIEHMDERIQHDKIEAGKPIALLVNESGDRVEIANESLSFDTLASLLRKIHALAEELADYRDPGSDAPFTPTESA